MRSGNQLPATLTIDEGLPSRNVPPVTLAAPGRFPQLDDDRNATYLVLRAGRSHPVVPPWGASHLEVIMSDIERRLREFTARLTQWWNSSARSARRRGTDGTAGVRRGAAEHVQR